MYKHIDQLRIYMLPKTVDILAINETRLDSSILNGEVSIPGYTLERKDRNRSGGGVALYIRDSINYKRLNDLPDANLELISIQVSKPRVKPFIVCTWYRPPGSTVDLMDRFEAVLQKLDSYQMEIDVIGDINCNVGVTPPDCSTQKLLDICETYQYSQLIDQPTRITKHTSSIIDLFLTNNPLYFSDIGVSDIGISDHCLVYAVRKICTPKSNPKIILSRCFKNFFPDNFRRDLSMVPWHLIELEDNPDIAWDMWQQMFLGIADYHAPQKKRRVRGISSPWITPELKKLMFQRDKLKKVASRFPTEVNWNSYKHLKNKVNYEIKNAKMNCYNAFFKENCRNIKNTWRGINRLIAGNESKSSKITQLETEDTITTDPIEISNVLNTHFSQIGPSLASQIQATSSKYTDYITPTEQIFRLTEISSQEILELIEKIPGNKASGLDNISARLLKEAAPVVTRSLSYIINLSITTGIFPNSWKIAKVTPIFKGDATTDPNNYRPISVLPIVSKLIKRIVFKQLYEYLNSNYLLTESQSGFRPMFSTETALLEMTNEWLWNIDNKHLNGVIFLDLKKSL